jgi:hypothetical protein
MRVVAAVQRSVVAPRTVSPPKVGCFLGLADDLAQGSSAVAVAGTWAARARSGRMAGGCSAEDSVPSDATCSGPTRKSCSGFNHCRGVNWAWATGSDVVD